MNHKKKLLALFIGFLLGANMMAQSTKDVVYLKNGSVIKGTVSNVIPNETVTITTADGNVFVFNMSEVTQISNEDIPDSPDWANDMMTRKGSILFIGDRELSANEIQELFNNDVYQTYVGGAAQLKKGNHFLITGLIFLGASAGMMVAAENAFNNDDNIDHFGKGDMLNISGLLLAIPANVFTSLGCVFRGFGNGRLKWIVNEYNDSFMNSKRVSYNLEPGIVTTNGFALQNTSFAPGLRFTMKF